MTAGRSAGRAARFQERQRQQIKPKDRRKHAGVNDPSVIGFLLRLMAVETVARIDRSIYLIPFICFFFGGGGKVGDGAAQRGNTEILAATNKQDKCISPGSLIILFVSVYLPWEVCPNPKLF